MVVTGQLILHTAFSRDQPHKVCWPVQLFKTQCNEAFCQVYVQHCIVREGKAVWQWLHEQKASVFIAGYVSFVDSDLYIAYCHSQKC